MTKGTFGTGGSPSQKVALAPYRLRDGSATFLIPQGWRVQEIGAGQFGTNDPNGSLSFIIASVDVLSPSLRVKIPGAFVAPYMPPHKALQFLVTQQGDDAHRQPAALGVAHPMSLRVLLCRAAASGPFFDPISIARFSLAPDGGLSLSHGDT